MLGAGLAAAAAAISASPAARRKIRDAGLDAADSASQAATNVMSSASRLGTLIAEAVADAAQRVLSGKWTDDDGPSSGGQSTAARASSAGAIGRAKSSARKTKRKTTGARKSSTTSRKSASSGARKSAGSGTRKAAGTGTRKSTATAKKSSLARQPEARDRALKRAPFAPSSTRRGGGADPAVHQRRLRRRGVVARVERAAADAWRLPGEL